MSRRNKHHYIELPKLLSKYADGRALEYHAYSPYHMRLSDSGYTTLDVWTTGRYYVLTTDYNELAPDLNIIERGGEKGQLPTLIEKDLFAWLDKLFFAADMENASA